MHSNLHSLRLRRYTDLQRIYLRNKIRISTVSNCLQYKDKSPPRFKLECSVWIAGNVTTTLLLHAVWQGVIRRVCTQNSTRKVTINSTLAIILRCSKYNMNARLLIYGKSAEFRVIDKICCLKLEEIGGHALRQPLRIMELWRDSYYNLVREYKLILWLVEPERMATYSLII